ncbi:MAG: flagellar hook capping FlgD N-terminal domain-containing protein [Eubacteriales bacterium]|nr:flagellar hook capping FlgD N-terminal domain-containing protein [Eubacteriales bacterium]MDD4421742.1 flagellar hook capping FlgD N-terminal domain-containing protein [Eubacteriales bacterium]HBR31047.1 hypothetical protein [Clostridiales bacterium]
MIVDGINAALSANAYISPTKAIQSNADLGIDDFFALMAAQLENQSMDSTVDNTQFIAQMAQFATLSQINQLSAATLSNTAVSLLGKTVSVQQYDSSGLSGVVIGEVEQVSYKDGEPYILVEGGYYKLGDILDIDI